MKQKNWKDSFLSVFGYAIISIFAIICVIPLVMVISCSFTDEITLMQKGYNLFPEKFSLEAYKYIFGGDSVLNGYKVTLFVTIVGTSLSLLITSAVSYALSVKKLKYRNCITFLIFFTMLFNGGLVPSYYLISRILNMRDSVWVMIIPCLVNPFFVFLLRNFFKTIPGALAESAKIDGANDITILFKIVMPISLPAMATIGLFYALDYWNSWFNALLYIDKVEMYPLQYLIVRIINNISFTSSMFAVNTLKGLAPAYSIRMATAVMAIGPIIILYPFMQKFFIQGLMVGSIKE